MHPITLALTALALTLPGAALAQPLPKPLPAGTKVSLLRPTDADEVFLRLIGVQCTALTKLVRNADGTFDGSLTCGAVTIKSKRIPLDPVQQQAPPQMPVAMTDARIESGTVTILAIGPTDLFVGRAGEIVGKVCNITQPLVRNAGGSYYAGELTCGASRYYFAAVSVASGSVVLPTNVPAPVNAGPQIGERWRIIDAGDVYPTINTTECLAWPNAEAKRKGGDGSWSPYAPQNGDVGMVLGVARHCNQDIDVIFLQIGAYVVPIGQQGIERAP